MEIGGEDNNPKLMLSASPSGGQVSSGTTVYLTAKAEDDSVSDCDIYYTLNGNTPTKSSTKYTSSGITINSDCTLKAIAYKSGYEDSEVLTATYTIKETPKPKLVLSASPSGGQVSAGTTVYLTAKADGSTVSDCDIYYTLDGSTPSTSSTKYTSSGITINSDCTLKAIAYKDGYEDSDVLTANFTVKDDAKPSGGQKVVAVSAGYCHSMALMDDGTLWACGNNLFGQLGDGTTTFYSTPKQVMTDVAAVSAGTFYTMILKTDGTLWACGRNQDGQLGDGTTTDCITPKQVMTGVAAVSAGETHTMILKTDGTLWACGRNDCGELGDGTTTERSTPKRVMTDVAAVSAGLDHTMILKTDGTLWACGNYIGQFGGTTTHINTTPKQVMTGVAAVSAGSFHTMILKIDGTLWTCGYNSDGQLGDGTTTNRNTPKQVMTGVAAVSAGGNHTMILKTDGTLWACGKNDNGQLGDGTTTDCSTPKQVMTGVAAVSAGETHTMILKTDGTLWACGDNLNGKLGDGTTTDRLVPVKVLEGKRHPKLQVFTSHNGGQISKGTTITLTAKAEGNTILGCDIYYTLDGSTPTKNSTPYTSSGITINSDCTLKAIAYKDGYETSDVLTEVYTIKYDDIRLSIASAGYATFYSSESAYKLPSGLSAKVVKGAGNGKLTYETIIIIDGSNTNIVPKGVPVMIENSTKQAGTYTLTAVESDATYTGTNLLRGSDEAMTTTGDGYHYKLSYGPSGTKWNDVFGWYWGAKNGGEFQIEGHKAWLVVPRNGTRAAGFNIEGESLDIETIDHSPSTTDYYYDLQGRRITDMKDAMPSKKGVYIRNGQKVVVK